MASAKGIHGAYKNCLAESCEFLTKSGRAVRYVEPTFENRVQQLVVNLSEPLYFRDWPYRAGSSSRIDILADITETISLPDAKCIRSTLRMNYFRSNRGEEIACDAIHYDFDATVQAQHPVCHAQPVNSILEHRPDNFPDNVIASPIAERHQTIRIPSAFVNLAGLFAKLTADHLPAREASEFWDNCKVYIDRIPDHASTDICTAIFLSNTLRSYGWYRWAHESKRPS